LVDGAPGHTAERTLSSAPGDEGDRQSVQAEASNSEQVEERPVSQPNEVLVKNQAIGVNFADTPHCAGTPCRVTLPLIPGMEATGTYPENR
jgi:NADPH:quinone reductase-like Zn-dependent oxidoreductase